LELTRAGSREIIVYGINKKEAAHSAAKDYVPGSDSTYPPGIDVPVPIWLAVSSYTGRSKRGWLSQ
jgi:hypothetical protein